MNGSGWDNAGLPPHAPTRVASITWPLRGPEEAE